LTWDLTYSELARKLAKVGKRPLTEKPKLSFFYFLAYKIFLILNSSREGRLKINDMLSIIEFYEDDKTEIIKLIEKLQYLDNIFMKFEVDNGTSKN
jgi:hypothetical protein